MLWQVFQSLTQGKRTREQFKVPIQCLSGVVEFHRDLFFGTSQDFVGDYFELDSLLMLAESRLCQARDGLKSCLSHYEFASTITFIIKAVKPRKNPTLDRPMTQFHDFRVAFFSERMARTIDKTASAMPA